MQVGGKHLIVIGDRVVIKPERPEERTEIGLYLPQSVVEKESVQGGRIVSVGPGIPLPLLPDNEDEPWRQRTREARFIPLQAQVGDYALYLRKEAVEIKFEGDKYIIIPHNAILALVRDEHDELLGE